MENKSQSNAKEFPRRKVSTDQAIKILKKNGLHINEEQANEILDFLYLIAKTTLYAEESYTDLKT